MRWRRRAPKCCRAQPRTAWASVCPGASVSRDAPTGLDPESPGTHPGRFLNSAEEDLRCWGGGIRWTLAESNQSRDPGKHFTVDGTRGSVYSTYGASEAGAAADRDHLRAVPGLHTHRAVAHAGFRTRLSAGTHHTTTSSTQHSLGHLPAVHRSRQPQEARAHGPPTGTSSGPSSPSQRHSVRSPRATKDLRK